MKQLTDRPIKTVYIKKACTPLTIANYQQTSPTNSRRTLRQEMNQWELYADVRKEFLDTHERVKQVVMNEGNCPESLWREYRDIKPASS